MLYEVITLLDAPDDLELVLGVDPLAGLALAGSEKAELGLPVASYNFV